MAQTIPSPTPAIVDNAQFAVNQWAERNGVSLTEQAFDELVAVQAGLVSEVNWLRNMIHDPAGLAEFLQNRQEAA